MRSWMSWEQTEPSVAPTDATGGDPTAYVIRGDPMPAIGLALLAVGALLTSFWLSVQHEHATLGLFFFLVAGAAAFFFAEALARARRALIVIGPMGVYFARRPGDADAAMYQWRDIEAVLRMKITTGNQSQWRTTNAIGVQLRRPRGPVPVVPVLPPDLLPQGIEERVRRRVEMNARQPSRTVGRLSVNRAQLASAIRRYAPFVPLIDAPVLDFRLSRHDELALRRAQRRFVSDRVGRTRRPG
jgi:hypothetical protein